MVKKIIRYALYIISGILVFIFAERIPEAIAYVVGSVMLLYGIEGLIGDIKRRKAGKGLNKLSLHIVLFVFAFIMFFIAREDIKLTCYIWAVWSIQREAEEIEENIFRHSYSKVVVAINIIESILITVLSILLIANPLEHLDLHIILLGIELILEIVWEVLVDINKKKEIKNENNSL